MITIQQMKAEVDRHLQWMVQPGGPGPQKSFDEDQEEGPQWADATFLVGGDEVSVTAEEGEGGRGYVEITVYEPGRKAAFRKFLDFGEDLALADQEYIRTLLVDMGTRVKFPVEPKRTQWSS